MSQQPYQFAVSKDKNTVSHIRFSARYKIELEKFTLLSMSIWSSGKLLDNCQFESLVCCIGFFF